jgi:hypothetical protein
MAETTSRIVLVTGAAGGIGRAMVASLLVAGQYPSGRAHLPFHVKPLSSVLMDDLKVAHKYGGEDGARDNFWG